MRQATVNGIRAALRARGFQVLDASGTRNFTWNSETGSALADGATVITVTAHDPAPDSMAAPVQINIYAQSETDAEALAQRVSTALSDYTGFGLWPYNADDYGDSETDAARADTPDAAPFKLGQTVKVNARALTPHQGKTGRIMVVHPVEMGRHDYDVLLPGVDHYLLFNARDLDPISADELRALQDEATEVGIGHGWNHANSVNAYGGPVGGKPVVVPLQYTNVDLSFYRSGWETGIDRYESGQWQDGTPRDDDDSDGNDGGSDDNGPDGPETDPALMGIEPYGPDYRDALTAGMTGDDYYDSGQAEEDARTGREIEDEYRDETDEPENDTAGTITFTCGHIVSSDGTLPTDATQGWCSRCGVMVSIQGRDSDASAPTGQESTGDSDTAETTRILSWDEPENAHTPRGWLHRAETVIGFYLDYGPDYYRSGHEYCQPNRKCPDCQPGSVLAVRYPDEEKSSHWFVTVAEARAWVEHGPQDAAPARTESAPTTQPDDTATDASDAHAPFTEGDRVTDKGSGATGTVLNVMSPSRECPHDLPYGWHVDVMFLGASQSMHMSADSFTPAPTVPTLPTRCATIGHGHTEATGTVIIVYTDGTHAREAFCAKCIRYYQTYAGKLDTHAHAFPVLDGITPELDAVHIAIMTGDTDRLERLAILSPLSATGLVDTYLEALAGDAGDFEGLAGEARWAAHLMYARLIGADHGTRAAQWIDIRDEKTAHRIIAGMGDDVDPEVMDAYMPRVPDGQYEGDYNWRQLCRDVHLTEDGESDDGALWSAYEEGFSGAAESEVVRRAREFVS